MKTIFDKIIITGLEIKNRIAAASVGRNLADIDGHIPESLYDIYRELAEGGAGLIISEMTMVSRQDYPVPGFSRLQDDDVIPEYADVDGCAGGSRRPDWIWSCQSLKRRDH